MFVIKVGVSFLSFYQDFKDLIPSHIPTIQISYILTYKKKKCLAIFVKEAGNDKTHSEILHFNITD